MSSSTGPGRPETATSSACRTAGATSCARRGWWFHFVTGTRHAQRIAFLKSIGADHGACHLSADAQDGNRIAHRIEQAGDGVAHARTGGHQHHPDPARAARIAFGRMHRGLLVTHQYMAQRGAAVQGVVQGQRGATGIAEERVDAAFDQRVQQDFGTVASVHDRACPSRAQAAASSRRNVLGIPAAATPLRSVSSGRACASRARASSNFRRSTPVA